MPAEHLIETLFPSDLPSPDHWEARYPPRELPEGAIATRFGPSPTGFLHTGGIFAALIAKDLARRSGGVFLVRIEDTDITREVAAAREQFSRVFDYLSLEPDENDDTGQYGPYEQSRRSQIYESYARDLLLRNRAYLCFCTREELAEIAARKHAAKLDTGYSGDWAHCRWLGGQEVEERIRSGVPYVVRFRSPDGPAGRVAYEDRIRGTIELGDNRNDVVILKSSDQILRLPTYHFAHAVDDHLMRINLVVRAEEWISSVPLHLQLFEALEFEQVPYAHIAPLMKLEGSSRRKLSKRQDPEANVDFYMQAGYPAGALLYYLRGLANSRLTEMSFELAAAEPIRLKECGLSGPLLDISKLNSISREFIARIPVVDAYDELLAWAIEHDPALAEILLAHPAIAQRALSIGRGDVGNARKDLAKWRDFRGAYGFLFSELFALVTDPKDARFAPVDARTVQAFARDLRERYQEIADAQRWFDQIRTVASLHGFSATKAEESEGRFGAGTIRDAANVVRVALTGSRRSLDLFQVAHVLGASEVSRRLGAVL